MLNTLIPMIAPAAGGLLKEALLGEKDPGRDLAGLPTSVPGVLTPPAARTLAFSEPARVTPLQEALAFAAGVVLGLMLAKHVLGGER
jgi:hypothetical protein